MSHRIEILDTTLRDGEQSPGVSFTPEQRFNLAEKLIKILNVDRIEIGSALSSDSDLAAFKRIAEWANEEGYQNRLEILTYVDHTRSVDWLKDVPCETLGLLCKSSVEHCQIQLGKKPEEHIYDITRTLEYIYENKRQANIFLEDWSRGYEKSKDYVENLLDSVSSFPVKRIYLCDTLGVLSPDKTREMCLELKRRFPQYIYELHAHNDYGLALANCLSSLDAGIRGFHTTVNGLGERAGNTPLEQLSVMLKDFSDLEVNISEGGLFEVSELVQNYSKKIISPNRPIVGSDVFTHTGGIHVDGQLKGNLYASKLSPDRFGRFYNYDLGKLSGRSAVAFHLKKAGLSHEEHEIEKIIVELKRDTEVFKEDAEQKLSRIISKIKQNH